MAMANDLGAFRAAFDESCGIWFRCKEEWAGGVHGREVCQRVGKNKSQYTDIIP